MGRPKKAGNGGSKPNGEIKLPEKHAQTEVVTFDTDGINDLSAGDIVSTVDLGNGFSFTVQGTSNSPSGIGNEAMIFDSEDEAGADAADDEDLLTDDQGNILIVSENGNSDLPDDEVDGGTLTFDFDNPLNVESIFVKDAFEGPEGGQITAYDSNGNEIGSVEIPSDGVDAEERTLELGFEDVSQLVVELAGSGGIDDLKLSNDEFKFCKDVSNIVAYLDCDGDDKEDKKVKFEFDGIETRTLSEFEVIEALEKAGFGDYDVLGMTVKAGNNFGNFGPGEGQFVDLDIHDGFDTGNTGKADVELDAVDWFLC